MEKVGFEKARAMMRPVGGFFLYVADVESHVLYRRTSLSRTFFDHPGVHGRPAEGPVYLMDYKADSVRYQDIPDGVSVYRVVL